MWSEFLRNLHLSEIRRHSLPELLNASTLTTTQLTGDQFGGQRDSLKKHRKILACLFCTHQRSCAANLTQDPCERLILDQKSKELMKQSQSKPDNLIQMMMMMMTIRMMSLNPKQLFI